MRTREEPVSTWRGLEKCAWAQPLVGRDGAVGGTWYNCRRAPGPGTKQSTVGVGPQGLSRGGRLGSDCAVVRVVFWWALVALGRIEGTQSATPGGWTAPSFSAVASLRVTFSILLPTPHTYSTKWGEEWTKLPREDGPLVRPTPCAQPSMLPVEASPPLLL